MIKKLLLAVLVLALVLGGVLVFNTFQFTSKQVEVDPVAAVEVDVDGAVKRLAKAITFKTVSYQNPEEFESAEFEGLHAYLENVFPLRTGRSNGSW